MPRESTTGRSSLRRHLPYASMDYAVAGNALHW
jgi:hypothetical protein